MLVNNILLKFAFRTREHTVRGQIARTKARVRANMLPFAGHPASLADGGGLDQANMLAG